LDPPLLDPPLDEPELGAGLGLAGGVTPLGAAAFAGALAAGPVGTATDPTSTLRPRGAGAKPIHVTTKRKEQRMAPRFVRGESPHGRNIQCIGHEVEGHALGGASKEMSARKRPDL